VPTARAINGHRNPSRYWQPSTILHIVRDPLNIGVARSIRSHQRNAPPDERHDYAWSQRVGVAADDQIVVPGVVQPPYILNEAEAREIERVVEAAPHLKPATKKSVHALLRGGVARCGQITADGTVCGGAMRVKWDGKPGIRPTTPAASMKSSRNAVPASRSRSRCWTWRRGWACCRRYCILGRWRNWRGRRPRSTPPRTLAAA
jgi:hypothetical protein